jgi:hypothetical protein
MKLNSAVAGGVGIMEATVSFKPLLRGPVFDVPALRLLLGWLKSPVEGWPERALFVALFAVLVAVRIPGILLHGRFWAEEGRNFFANAWNLPWWQALFAPHSGYVNVSGNLAALLARHLVPLAAAPYVTSGVALLIQCLPAILIARSRADWLQPRAVMLAALALIVAPPFVQETWLNSTNSHFHLTLAAAIILALEAQAGPALIFECVLLGLAGFAAPASWFLVPLFALRAILDRSSARTIQCVVFFAGLAIALAFFFSLRSDRGAGFDLRLLGAIIFTKFVAGPLSGPIGVKPLSDRLFADFTSGIEPLWPLATMIVIAAAAMMVVLRHPKRPPLWFMLAGATIGLASCATAFGGLHNFLRPGWGGRYILAPQVLLALAVLSLSATDTGRVRLVATALVVWLLLIDARYFFVTPEAFAQGPNWRAEVAAWQRDPSHRLLTWPAGWSVAVPSADRTRP